ncbi:platelet-derived growth factor subunit A isoform X1 [Hylaeus anthracinus]|uniref:platelet-derived growth factor subunit A isoform X1 n=1 Tax=Hylaeus anthracinus TaxID=313031 RepID=UPI0023B8FDDD|nr:platelet-derived growth factor subunit A isoform X1 [Hylaeus anthracinus]XP_053999677.1 platelet-derived growth factor subunit A isoform X1 [Hylaeus anthracinus]
MSHSRLKPLILTVFVIILVIGLVVAQRDTRLVPAVDSSGRSNELSKSLELAKKINSMDSIDEFLNLIHGVPIYQQRFGLPSRMGDTGERSNAMQPVPAKCMPELQPVSLKPDDDPSAIYFPSCTRIKRCGGCCSHSLLSCQPIATEFRNFEVFVVAVDQTNGLSYKDKRIVPLEEHTKCVCDCRIKAEHCNEKQSYVKEECRCACNNVDEAEKCYNNNDTKVWNPELCTCFCRDELECSTGFYFDQNTCRCRQVPLSRTWFPVTKGTDYRFGQTQKPDNTPPVIVPLDATDPRRRPKEDPER